MILLVDAGNSRIKWGWWADGQWLERGGLANAGAADLEPALRAHRPEWVGVSCVAGTAIRTRLAAALTGYAPAVYWLKPAATGHGIENSYRPAESLGSDRYAALIACRRRGLGPALVVSAGTALTIDALSPGGEFLGGCILPGRVLMRQALATGTAAVAVAGGEERDFPRCTADAVTSGIGSALAGAVAARRGILAAHAGTDVVTVVTGGDALWLAAMLAFPVIVIEDLVLEGLLWLARDLGVVGA